MNKRLIVICTLILSIIAVLSFIIHTTYSLVINTENVFDINKLPKMITIQDLIKDDNGIYKKEYYDVIKELDIDTSDANILIDSKYLNDALNKVLINVLNYRINNKKRLSARDISKLITDAINNDKTINNELKEKVITKTNQYIYDITDFIYDIDLENN